MASSSSSSTFSRLVVAFLLLASSASAQNSSSSNSTGGTCQLCPQGSTMGNTSKPFFGTSANAPTTCGGFDTQLSVVPSSLCNQTLTSFGILDFRYYCQCSGVASPGVCDLCHGAALVNPDVPNSLIYGYTCSQINDLAASVSNSSQCAQISAAAAICCAGGGGGGGGSSNSTTGNGTTTTVSSNATAAPSAAPATTNTSNGTNTSSGNSTCSVCADGSAPTSNFTIPLIGKSCQVFNQLPFPTESCALLKSSVSIGALCGCAGEVAPAICPLCKGGALIANSNQTLSISGLSLTCQEAQYFSSYASATLCNTSVSQFESVCCAASAGGSTPSAATTMSPAMMPAMTMQPAGPTAAGAPTSAPAPNAGTTTAAGAKSGVKGAAATMGAGAVSVVAASLLALLL